MPTNHLLAAGNYIVDKKPEVIICLGDFADMPSLCSYDKGKKSFEGRRYIDDIESAKEAMELFLSPIREFNVRASRNKTKHYRPRMVLLYGNHEDRITRAVEQDAILEGVISLSDLQYQHYGWETVPFENIIAIDGIRYSHFFRNPNSLRKDIVQGTIDAKLKNLGWSFTMGHQQTLQYGLRYLADGQAQHGLVCGSFYQHDEEYMGPQGNASHWRGMIMKNEVHDGMYDPCFISINYLLKEWL